MRIQKNFKLRPGKLTLFLRLNFKPHDKVSSLDESSVFWLGVLIKCRIPSNSSKSLFSILKQIDKSNDLQKHGPYLKNLLSPRFSWQDQTARIDYFWSFEPHSEGWRKLVDNVKTKGRFARLSRIYLTPIDQISKNLGHEIG